MNWTFYASTSVNQTEDLKGDYTIALGSDSLVNRTLKFWWKCSNYDTQTFASKFKLDWRIKNGCLPDMMEFVTRDLEGSVSTPGLGSLPPPSYYKEMHEYTAVIELPHNITEVVGEGALVLNVDIVPDSDNNSEVEILFAESTLEYNNVSLNWSAAEEFCVSKGGHLAAGAFPHQWQKLEDYMSYNGLSDLSIWLGGIDEANNEEGILSYGASIGSQWVPSKWKFTKSSAKCLT